MRAWLGTLPSLPLLPALPILRGLPALFALSALSAGCSNAAAAPSAGESAETVLAVHLADVERHPVARPVRGTGVVRLKREVDLSFKVGGVVAAVLVDEGAHVKKGQVLARLDPTELDAALRQAKEGATKADRDLDRVKKLHGSGALPVAELQNAETGAALARAGLDAASFNAQRATIVAPDDGRIDRRLAEAGEVMAPGRPVLHLSGESRGAVVRLGLTDRDALRVREGDAAKVVLDARPGAAIAATVTQRASVASPASGTFDVEVRLDEAPEGLLSGLTAKVEIAHMEDVAAVVPIGAIASGRAEDGSVFVVDAEGRARRVPVKLAFLDADRAGIAGGLDGKDRVVDTGATQLEDGVRVKVTP
jgi:membrane fusion protein, multidrug efflux system